MSPEESSGCCDGRDDDAFAVFAALAPEPPFVPAGRIPGVRCPTCPARGGIACAGELRFDFCRTPPEEIVRLTAFQHSLYRCRDMRSKPHEPPRRPPPDGRLRVALFGPCLFGGGAEEWQRLIVKTLDRERIAVVGVGVPDRKLVNLGIAEGFRELAPLALGTAECREMSADCDIALCWGLPRVGQVLPLLGRKPIVVMVSHMDTRNPWDLKVHAQAAIDRQAAVSELALAPIPVRQHASTAILPNGIDESRLVASRDPLELRAEMGIPRNAPVLGFLGRPQGDQKDPQALARALPHLPGWHGLFVGAWRHGGAEPVWHEIQEILGPRAHFPGTRRDIANMFSLMTRLIVPSRWECFCLVAAEAVAFGLPVLMTHTGIAQYHPHWFRPIPMDGKGEVLAAAILADCEDHRTAERVRVAQAECRAIYGSAAFGSRWSDWLVEVGATEPAR